MELETITVLLDDGTEAVINKADFDAEVHTLPASEKPTPRRRGRPKKVTD